MKEERGGGQGTGKRRARNDTIKEKALLGMIRQRWYSPSLGWQRVAELRHTHTQHHDHQTTAESRHK